MGSGPVHRHLRQRQAGPPGPRGRVQRGDGVAEMQAGEILQRVRMGARILRVGQQHAVIHRHGPGEPGTVQRPLASLRIVEHLQDGSVGQEGVERRPGLLQRNLLDGTVQVPLVPEREVAGPALPRRQSDPDQAADVRNRVDGEHAALPRRRQHGRQRCRVGEHGVGPERLPHLLRGGGRRILPHRSVQAEPGRGGAEPHAVQPPGERRPVQIAHPERLERLRHRRVVAQDHQLARQARLVGMGDQQLAALGRLHRGGRGEHALEVPELGQQLAGGLGSDTGHAGHVVHAVAHQRQQVGHLLRAAAVSLAHLVRTDCLLLDRVLHDHAGPDQLHQVLVGGHDRDAPARVHRRLGVCRDQVVRLPVGKLDRRHVERLGGIPHQRELRDQLGGRLGALCLIGVVDPIAERGPPGVEDHRQVSADMVLQQPCQHVGEAEHGVDGGAVRPGHRRQGVEGAEDEARAVHQHQVHGAVGCSRLGHAQCSPSPAPGLSTKTREQYGQ